MTPVPNSFLARRSWSLMPASRPRSAQPAIFLDKDGTVLEDVPYNVEPRHMQFAPGAALGLARLGRLGIPLIIISNQPGIGLGLACDADMDVVRGRLKCMFASVGAEL